jgi:hypothetical protein
VAGVGVSFVRGISPTDLKIGNLPGLRGKRGALIEGAFRPRPLSEKEMVRKRHHLGDLRPTLFRSDGIHIPQSIPENGF